MAKSLKIAISFGEVDEDIYDFLKTQKNASQLVRKLVERYMLTNSIGSAVNIQCNDNSNILTIEETEIVEETKAIETKTEEIETKIDPIHDEDNLNDLKNSMIGAY